MDECLLGNQRLPSAKSAGRRLPHMDGSRDGLPGNHRRGKSRTYRERKDGILEWGLWAGNRKGKGKQVPDGRSLPTVGMLSLLLPKRLVPWEHTQAEAVAQ